MIKTVFLDIDGTLLDFNACVKNSLREGFHRFCNGTYSEEMFPVFTQVNNRLWESLERGEIDIDYIRAHRFNRVFEALGLQGNGPALEEYFRNELFSSAIPMEGGAAIRLLEYLRQRGYRLCVASNGPYLQQVNRLTLAGMLPYFDFLFVSEDLGVQKPDMQFFARAAARIAAAGQCILPEECIIIGDSVSSDMQLGKNCGFKTCLYDPAGLRGKNSADWVIRSLVEIEAIL